MSDANTQIKLIILSAGNVAAFGLLLFQAITAAMNGGMVLLDFNRIGEMWSEIIILSCICLFLFYYIIKIWKQPI